jgi:hypothetical protein
VPFLTVEGGIDGVSRIAERGHELAIEIRIVLDDKKPQNTLPRVRTRPAPS